MTSHSTIGAERSKFGKAAVYLYATSESSLELEPLQVGEIVLYFDYGVDLLMQAIKDHPHLTVGIIDCADAIEETVALSKATAAKISTTLRAAAGDERCIADALSVLGGCRFVMGRN